MAFTTINLTEAVSPDELQAYGAGQGQMDNFPTGIAVFGVNNTTATISAGTVYLAPNGSLSSASASGSLELTTIADCPAGWGIYGVAQGLLPDGSAFKSWTVAEQPTISFGQTDNKNRPKPKTTPR